MNDLSNPGSYKKSLSFGEGWILLVEDNPLNSRLYHANLTRAGFSVRIAPDGLKALEILEEFTPDLIIADINMPAMNGFELRSQLLSNERFRAIPFLFLTSRASKEDTLYGLKLEVDDYIVKSAGPELLIAKVKTLLSRRAALKYSLTSELVDASQMTSAQLFATHPPEIEGLRILQWHQPHETVPGGDFLDYIQIDADSWLVVVADVMGKRWKAWMFAHAYIAYLRSSIRSLAAENSSGSPSPAGILNRLNEILREDLPTSEILCSLAILYINRSKKCAIYSDAAHLPLLRYNAKCCRVEYYKSKSTFLGYFTKEAPEEQCINLSAGDRLMVFTDGLSEAVTPTGEMLGISGVTHWFLVSYDLPFERSLSHLKTAVHRFTKKTSFSDDLTAIIFEVY